MDNGLLHEGLIGLKPGEALKALWGRYARAQSTALQSLRSARELRALSDRGLRDIGLRRDQINCITRQIPC